MGEFDSLWPTRGDDRATATEKIDGILRRIAGMPDVPDAENPGGGRADPWGGRPCRVSGAYGDARDADAWMSSTDDPVPVDSLAELSFVMLRCVRILGSRVGGQAAFRKAVRDAYLSAHPHMRSWVAAITAADELRRHAGSDTARLARMCELDRAGGGNGD